MIYFDEDIHEAKDFIFLIRKNSQSFRDEAAIRPCGHPYSWVIMSHERRMQGRDPEAYTSETLNFF